MEKFEHTEEITELWKDEEFDSFDMNSDFPPKISRKTVSAPALLSSRFKSIPSQTYSSQEWKIVRKNHSESEVRKNWGFIRGVKSDTVIPKLDPDEKSWENNIASNSDNYFNILKEKNEQGNVYSYPSGIMVYGE